MYNTEKMITLTKIDGNSIVINAEEIEIIESNYNSTLFLKSGRKIVVLESPEDIIDKVIKFKNLCYRKESPEIVRGD